MGVGVGVGSGVGVGVGVGVCVGVGGGVGVIAGEGLARVPEKGTTMRMANRTRTAEIKANRVGVSLRR